MAGLHALSLTHWNTVLTARKSRASYERDWLTRAEFAELLEGAECPFRDWPGMVERDRLVLMGLLLSGMRPSELIAVRWGDLDLGWRRPSLLISSVKGDRRRRQPLPRQLSRELRDWRELRSCAPSETVFCGLTGARLRTSRLEQIIGRAAYRVDLNRRVSARILRNTAAAWLKQAGASPSLIAAYLGEADSPTDKYADGESENVRAAVQSLADHAIENRELVIACDDSVRPASDDWPFAPLAGQ
jgi:integrase